MDFEVSDEATPLSTCLSFIPSELLQPAVEQICVTTLDEHLQVISIPLTNSRSLEYLVDRINMESMVDEIFEQTSHFRMNLIQVTTSDAPKVFDRMPKRKVGLCSEELCSPVVCTLILQASNNSCTLGPDICGQVFDPGGVLLCLLLDHHGIQEESLNLMFQVAVLSSYLFFQGCIILPSQFAAGFFVAFMCQLLCFLGLVKWPIIAAITSTELPNFSVVALVREPELLLERKMVTNQGGTTVTKVLIKWTDAPKEEVTSSMHCCVAFQILNLEVKVLKRREICYRIMT